MLAPLRYDDGGGPDHAREVLHLQLAGQPYWPSCQVQKLDKPSIISKKFAQIKIIFSVGNLDHSAKGKF